MFEKGTPGEIEYWNFKVNAKENLKLVNGDYFTIDNCLSPNADCNDETFIFEMKVAIFENFRVVN